MTREPSPADLAIEISADSRWLLLVREYVNLLARQLDLTHEEALQLEMCVDEACSNSIHAVQKLHADPDKCKVRLELRLADEHIRVTVIDCGGDFSEHFHNALPMTGLTDRTRKRGYGLQIIKTLMDEVSYEHDPHHGNRLHFTKFVRVVSDK